MPNVWATKTGNWSDTTVWNTGTLPTASDAVWASGSTVLIDQDINVISLNNFTSGSIGSGGTFNCYSSRIITASLNSGTTTTSTLTLTGSGITVNILGNISGSNTATAVLGTLNVPNTFVGSTINITGNYGGNAGVSSYAILFTASGSTLNIIGNSIPFAVIANALFSTPTNSTINILGNIVPGTGGTVLIAGGTSNTYNLTGSVVTGGTSGGITFNAISSSFNMSGSLSSLTTITNAFQFNMNAIASTLRIIGNISGSTGQNSGLVLGGANNTIIVTGSVLGHPSTAASQAVIPGGYQNNLIISGNILPNVGGGILFNNITTPLTCSLIGDIITTSSAAIGVTFGNTTAPILFNITGSIYVAGGGLNRYGISLGNAATANNITLNITGSIYSGINASSNAAHGIICGAGLNTINIKGDVYGGIGGSYGIYNNSTSTIIASGSAYAGTSSVGSYGAVNNSTGILRVTNAVGSVSSSALYGVSPFGLTTYESMTFPTNGLVPLVGYCEMVVGANSFASCSLSASGYNVLIDSNNITNGQPTASNVRSGTTYNFGATTGTMVVPSSSYVALGTPVDNTSGSAILISGSISSAVWDTQLTAITTTGSIGDRLKNSATVANVGNQLVSLL